MSLPVILQPQEGRSVQIRTSTCTNKSDRQRYTRSIWAVGVRDGARNRRRKSSYPQVELIEMFYVVEGEVELIMDQRRVIAAPGAFMLVPENTPHGFSNPGQRDQSC